MSKHSWRKTHQRNISSLIAIITNTNRLKIPQVFKIIIAILQIQHHITLYSSSIFRKRTRADASAEPHFPETSTVPNAVAARAHRSRHILQLQQREQLHEQSLLLHSRFAREARERRRAHSR